MNKRVFYRLAGLLFILLMALVFILNIIIPDKEFSEEENRVLQSRPKFSISKYMDGRLESKIETYASDQFLLRNKLIKVKSAMDVTIGKLEANGVIRANDGYLMETIKEPSKGLLNGNFKALKRFKAKYSNLKMYFLMAPNAANILDYNLPLTVKTKDQNALIDRFYKKIKSYGYNTIDVRKALKEADENGTQVYYRTDHHWTTDGAYAAYKQAVKSMGLTDNVKYDALTVKNDFSGTLGSKSGFTNGKLDAIKIYLPKSEGYKNSVIYYADSKKKTTEFYEMDNLNIKDAYTVFGGSNHPMYTIKTPSKSRERLLIIKDSYANCFIPFLTQNYREIVVIDPRYYFDNLTELISTEKITQVLFLYNGNTFFEDDSLQRLL